MSVGRDSELGTSPSEPVEGSAPALSEPATRADRQAARRERRALQRFAFEHVMMRLIATCGVVAIGVAIAAIMVSSGSQGWLVGLVVSIVSVVISGAIWSARTPTRL